MSPQDRTDRLGATQLRAIAAWLDSHPEFPISGISTTFPENHVVVTASGGWNGEQLAAVARSIGGRWDKNVTGGDDYFGIFELTQEILPGVKARLFAMRENVCERVVTGTVERTVTAPDPEAVAQLPTVTRTETIETFEWRCAPLLAGAGS